MATAGPLPPATRPPGVNSVGRVPVAGAGSHSWDDLRKKAHSRLVERVDPARNKHKPISILRQESRRTLDQYFEAEFPYVLKEERAKLIEEVLGEAVGLGLLEELFRDEAVQEILILAHNQIITRRGEQWLPSSITFRDAAHFRTILTRTIEQGESLLIASNANASFDVRLPNGFRVVAVIPPAVMDLNPMVAFTKCPVPSGSHVVAVPGPRMGGGGSPHQSPTTSSSLLSSPTPKWGSAVVTTPGPRSSTNLTSSPRSGVGLFGGQGSATESVHPSSAILSTPAPRKPADQGPNSGIYGNDPYSKIRGRITQRLISKIASAGVYDIQQIPKAEMQRIVSTMVEEANARENLGLSAAEQGRLTLEILTAMQA